MKILLVRTKRIPQAITLSDIMFAEPVGLEIIYGVLKKDHDLEIFDLMCEDISLTGKLQETEPDLVGFTSLCIDVHQVMEGAREVKAYDPAIGVIVGGTQAYLNPEVFFDDAVDAVFHYTTKENLISYFNEGIPQKGVLTKKEGYKASPLHNAGSNFAKNMENEGVRINPGEDEFDRNEALLPDRSSTEKYRKDYSYFGYKPAAIMQISRGCKNRCNFCLRWRIEGCNEQELDLKMIEEDLQQIQEETVMLYDNDILGSAERVRRVIEIFGGLKKKKNLIAYASVQGILTHKDKLKALKDTGLKALLVGYESFKDEEMIHYQKKSRVKENFEAASLLKAAGIDVWASFMAHPDWDKEDFKAFRRYVKALRPEISSVSPLTPFPNLPLYEEYKDRLLFEKEDYEKWSFGQVTIQPGKLSLKNYYREMLKTNLYINLILNRPTEMLKKYGVRRVTSLTAGSIKSLYKYYKLVQTGNEK